MVHGIPYLVDDEDYEKLSSITWRPQADGYLMGRVCGDNPHWIALRGHDVRLHRLIVFGESYRSTQLLADHINRNKLDNTRSNLRAATHLINATNRSKSPGTTSVYKGVTFKADDVRQWYMRLKVDRKYKHTKAFKTERAAAIAYDILARQEWGEFAVLNIPNAPQDEVDDVMLELKNPKRLNGSSKYVGVTKIHDNRWIAKVKLDGKHIYIGGYTTEVAAAVGYNAFVLSHPAQSKNRLNVI